MNTMKDASATCCPEFKVVKWDGTTHSWKNKLFIRETIPQIFHMPLPGTFGKKVIKLMDLAKKADAELPEEDLIMLCYELSSWKSVLLLGVSKVVAGAHHENLSGKFISKVFDGPYSQIPKFIKEMDLYMKGLGKSAKKYYFYYAYCPKCAKKYGHNYMVIFSEI